MQKILNTHLYIFTGWPYIGRSSPPRRSVRWYNRHVQSGTRSRATLHGSSMPTQLHWSVPHLSSHVDQALFHLPYWRRSSTRRGYDSRPPIPTFTDPPVEILCTCMIVKGKMIWQLLPLAPSRDNIKWPQRSAAGLCTGKQPNRPSFAVSGGNQGPQCITQFTYIFPDCPDDTARRWFQSKPSWSHQVIANPWIIPCKNHPIHFPSVAELCQRQSDRGP